MGDVLQASKGQQAESETLAGPSSYPTGGFSHRSDLGRVDAVHGDVDDGTQEVTMTASDDNAVVIQAFSQGGGEIAAGTDLSGDTYTYTAHRL